MSARLTFTPGDAQVREWPEGQDVVRLSPGLLEQPLIAQGFERLEHAEVIPGITRAITAVKRSY